MTKLEKPARRIGVDNKTESEEQKLLRTISPILSRGGNAQEITAIIPNLDFGKVREVVLEGGHSNGSIRTGDNYNYLLDKIFQKGIKSHLKGSIVDPTEGEIRLAQEYYRANLIPNLNQAFVEVCQGIFIPNGLRFESIFGPLDLEMFYIAVTLANLGDETRLSKYFKIAETVGGELAKSNLDKKVMILNMVNSQLGKVSSGILIGVDSEKGTIIYESREETLRRLKSRLGIVDKETSRVRDGRRL